MTKGDLPFFFYSLCFECQNIFNNVRVPLVQTLPVHCKTLGLVQKNLTVRKSSKLSPANYFPHIFYKLLKLITTCE